ncbi:hypothetical protein A3743_23200 [Oleiphilus sp. HI0072]|nr:hypothetical protein A3743_23200 [Oleiphilus sp. HI0072]
MLSKGLAYEQIAEKYLRNLGLKSITNNCRSKVSEIDLIMGEKNNLVFIEVRYRARNNYGIAAETVTPHKQKKIIKTASIFLSHKKLWNMPCRFDVISISQKENSLSEQIHWHKAAFDASY